MNPKLVKSISTQIYRRFPEMFGVQPKVRLQIPPQGKSTQSIPNYLFTYSSQAKVQDGKTIKRWVRVVVNEQGKILKITTSK